MHGEKPNDNKDLVAYLGQGIIDPNHHLSHDGEKNFGDQNAA